MPGGDEAKKITVVFRADASKQIGGGHVMRCLALADVLTRRGARCLFACLPNTMETAPALVDSGYELLELNEPGHAASLATAMARRRLPRCDWLIVDHYGWDVSQESACRSFAGSILAIDDLADRVHDCDMLLDQTFGRDPVDYDALTPSHCRKLIGPSYALLRPEFAAARPEALARRKSGAVRRVLVSMGLTDPSNATSLVLEGIAKSGLPLKVDVVLGPAAPHLAAVRKIATASAGAIELHENPPSMPVLMMKADVAFGAGGSSSWERCCLGLPSILLVIADNQKEVVANLSSQSAIIALGDPDEIDVEEIAAVLRDLNARPERLAELEMAAAAICDGRGAYRIQMMLDPAMTDDGTAVWLRPAERDDMLLVYGWQIEPGTRQFSRNQDLPSYESHCTWFERRLSDPGTLLNIVVADAHPCGVLRLDHVAPKTFEISILTASAFRRRGIADSVLKCAAGLVPEATLRAEVLEGNLASEALFARAGFQPSGFGVKHLASLDSRLH